MKTDLSIVALKELSSHYKLLLSWIACIVRKR